MNINEQWTFVELNSAQWMFIATMTALILIEIGLCYYFDKKDNQ